MGRGGQPKRVISHGTDGCGEICQSEHRPVDSHTSTDDNAGTHSNAHTVVSYCHANTRFNSNCDSHFDAHGHAHSGAHRHAGPTDSDPYADNLP